MTRLVSFLGGALAGAGVLAAVACVVTHLSEGDVPTVTDVVPNVATDGAHPAPATDNGAESV